MSATVQTHSVNGINLDMLQETVGAIKNDPKLGSCRFRARNKWGDAAHNCTMVTEFRAGGQEIAHKQPFELHADEPALLAGDDQGANPVEHLLNALAGCITTSMVAHAAVRGISIEALESELEGDIDQEEPIRYISQEPGWDAHGIEGAFVVKHEGTYYLFYSSWTRGYAVGYATATDIRGPWTKHPDNPLFGAVAEGARGIRYGKPIDDPDFPYTHVGHNAVFRGPDGRWWTVCHAQRKDNPQEMMLIDPFWFDDDGNIRIHAPTYAPQEVAIDPEMLRRFPGLAE